MAALVISSIFVPLQKPHESNWQILQRLMTLVLRIMLEQLLRLSLYVFGKWDQNFYFCLHVSWIIHNFLWTRVTDLVKFPFSTAFVRLVYVLLTKYACPACLLLPLLHIQPKVPAALQLSSLEFDGFRDWYSFFLFNFNFLFCSAENQGLLYWSPYPYFCLAHWSHDHPW